MKDTHMKNLQALALLIAASLALGWSWSSNKTQTPDALLDRVVVMGASVSAGFGLCKEIEVATPLARLVDSAIVHPKAPALHLGENLFFLSPEYTGKHLMDQAVASQPTLVIAVDFLFWYGMYWRLPDAEARMQALELGLAQLERLSCPVVIGDFPDIRRALQGRHEVTKRPVVFLSMIPSETSRAAMNARVNEWAQARENVAVVPLSAFLNELASDEPLILPGGQVLQGSIAEILQVDLLHPKLAGCQALVLVVFEAISRKDWGLDLSRIRWSFATMRENLWELTRVVSSSAT